MELCSFIPGQVHWAWLIAALMIGVCLGLALVAFMQGATGDRDQIAEDQEQLDAIR